MKKLLLLLSIPLLFFSSCEEDEVNQPLGNLGDMGYFHADGHFYKTIDSGVNWIDQGDNSLLLDDVKGISFVSAEIGYCQNEGRFYKTIDSGANWTDQGYISPNDIDGISFVN